MAERGNGRVARARTALTRLDSQPALVRVAKYLRGRLPGDKDYGDALSVAGDEPPHIIGQRLSAMTAERPSALREVGLSALQVWQGLAEAQGRGRGEDEQAIMFTDLVEFSNWALEAGDTASIDLLRQVGNVVEPPIQERDGRIVKRLGDGLMAVFPDPQQAVEAACAASSAVEGVELDGYRPRMRAGIHLGRPRKLGSDYLGVDVNIAARVAAAAGPGEVLVSESVCERLSDDAVQLRKRWRFKAKGAPRDLNVYTARLQSS